MAQLISKGLYIDGHLYRNPMIAYAEEKADQDNVQEPDLTGSKIVEFFKGRTIFLTGATGFLGKVMMEKLLRSCPDLEEIIVICREKKGKDMNERMDAIFDDPLYARLSKVDPKFRQRVTILSGDVKEPGLGLSEKDRNLITSKASVIIHCAATVRFDEPLKNALQINMIGTQQMLQLASDCSKLVSMLCISTAYSNSNRSTIEEKFYPVPIQPNELISLMKTKTTEEIDEMAPSFMDTWPNTYTFSKALTETLIKQTAGSLPVAVVRPSIILSTYKEPMRGWVDNIQGPAGITLGTGLGLIHTLHCNGSGNVDLIPIDLVVSTIIAVAYKRSITKFDEIPIYNCVASPQSPLTWQEFVSWNLIYGKQVPPAKNVWCCWLIITKYQLIYQLLTVMIHIIPAAIFDGAAIAMGKKPRLLKLYKTIHKFSTVLSYFLTRTWTFSNTNVQSLWDEISPEDRIVFPFDASEISWLPFLEMYSLGVRTFILKDDPSTIPHALVKFNRFWLAQVILQGIFYLVVLRLMYGLLTMVFPIL